MRNASPEESVWMLLPILFVIIGLIAAVLYLPKNKVDTSSRANLQQAVITPSPTPIITPEVVCTDIYSPVCGQGVTYASPCEANLAGVTTFTAGACPTPTAATFPVSR